MNIALIRDIPLIFGLGPFPPDFFHLSEGSDGVFPLWLRIILVLLLLLVAFWIVFVVRCRVNKKIFKDDNLFKTFVYTLSVIMASLAGLLAFAPSS